jgi:Holliday junction resolvasome RuvABC endonuclease subunit
MKTLAFDVSTVATGWALMNDDKIIDYAVICPPDDLSESAKYFYITHSVLGLLKLYRPNTVVIEDTFFAKDPTVLKKLNRIAGQIMFIWFQSTGRESVFYMAMTARKDFPGLNGRSKKEEIVEAVNKHFELRGRVKDHNIADALVLGYHHYLVNRPEVGPTDSVVKEKARKK